MEQGSTPLQEGKKKTGSLSFRSRDTRLVAAKTGSYTRFVGRLKIALPIFVFLVLLVLMVWPMVRSHRLSQPIADNIVPNLVVENLRVTGVTLKDEPYMVMAQKALQVPEMKGVVDLENPKGEMTLSGGAWLAGQASKGRFDQKSKKLWLGGNVEMFHDRGYQFSTNEAYVDLGQNAAWGQQPIVIQGTFGEIHGQGFRLLEGGKVVVVTGQSKALLNLHTASPSGSNKP